MPNCLNMAAQRADAALCRLARLVAATKSALGLGVLAPARHFCAAQTSESLAPTVRRRAARRIRRGGRCSAALDASQPVGREIRGVAGGRVRGAGVTMWSPAEGGFVSPARLGCLSA